MDSCRARTPEFTAVYRRDTGVSLQGPQSRLKKATRLLLIAGGFALFSTQAQALPLAFGCAPLASGAATVECQPVLFRSVLGPALPGTLSPEAFVRLIVDSDATSSKFLNSLDGSTPDFPLPSGPRESIQFSMTTHDTETGVVARMQAEPLRSGMDEVALNSGSGDALADQFPVPRAATLLLISSGLALTATRRRRGSRLLDEQAEWAVRKEVSIATSVARSFRSTQRVCHSNPLRI